MPTFRSTLQRWLAGATVCSLAALALPALAQTHEDDIQVSVSAGRISVGGAHHTTALGLPVFEGDFGDLAGGLYKTDDPGFDSATGTFAAGTQLRYQAHGELRFWNGSAWSAAFVPSGVTVVLDGNLGEQTIFGAGGVTGDPSGLVGQAGANGQVHEHLDWTVLGANRTTPGAYLVTLSLAADGLQSSSPFLLALNRGLDEMAFEAAVASLAAPVPEPASAAALAMGLGLMGWRLRRTRRAPQPH
jgi:hypothetical protein